MPIGSALIVLALGVLTLAGARQYRSGTALLIGGALLLGLAYVLLTRGLLQSSLFGDPIVLDVVGAGAAMILLLAVLGLVPESRPRWLPAHRGESDFDARLHTLVSAARAVMDDPNAWGERGAAELRSIGDEIRALKAPNAAWAGLRDGWVAVCDQCRAVFLEPSNQQRRSGFLKLYSDVFKQTALWRLRDSHVPGRRQSRGFGGVRGVPDHAYVSMVLDHQPGRPELLWLRLTWPIRRRVLLRRLAGQHVHPWEPRRPDANGPAGAGDREPRRPPDAPLIASVALPEPTEDGGD